MRVLYTRKPSSRISGAHSPNQSIRNARRARSIIDLYIQLNYDHSFSNPSAKSSRYQGPSSSTITKYERNRPQSNPKDDIDPLAYPTEKPGQAVIQHSVRPVRSYHHLGFRIPSSLPKVPTYPCSSGTRTTIPRTYFINNGGMIPIGVEEPPRPDQIKPKHKNRKISIRIDLAYAMNRISHVTESRGNRQIRPKNFRKLSETQRHSSPSPSTLPAG